MFSRIAVATLTLCLCRAMPSTAQTTSDDVTRLRAAAEKGDAHAQIELGLAYENGAGVPVDKAEALTWYLKAAEQGEHMAAFSAGLLLYSGDTLPQDPAGPHKQDLVGAWTWLDIAMSFAPDMERPIYERAREDAAKKMTPAEIAGAQKQSREWLDAFWQRPVRTGVDVSEPVRTKYVPPDYPKAAVKSKTQGDVRLELTVGTDGRVRSAKVLSSPSAVLDAPALDAVKQWEFEPAHVKGHVVPVILTVTLTFSLK